MRMNHAVGCLLILALASACLPTAPSPSAPSVVVAVVILDQSDSNAVVNQCDQLAARVDTLLILSNLNRLDLQVLGTGDASSQGEPAILVPWATFSEDIGFLEHPERRDRGKERFRTEIYTSCTAHIRTRAQSPIWNAVQRGADTLIARCEEHSRAGLVCSSRFLALHSDLRETEFVPITARLAAPGKGRPKKSLPVLPPPPLDGVIVSVCGVSDFVAEKRQIDTATLTAVWREALGPAAPTAFAPCCATNLQSIHNPVTEEK